VLNVFWLIFVTLCNAQVGSLFGIGAQSSGMGGVSHIQGRASPTQVFSSPASLGSIREVTVSLSGVYLDPRLKPFGSLVLNSNGTRGTFDSAGVLPGGGQVISGAFPIGKDRPLVFSGAIFLPFSSLIRVSGNPVNYPYYPLYHDITRNFFFVLGAGYEFIDGFFVGFNLRSTTKSSTNYTLRSDSNVNYTATATEARGQNRISLSFVYDHERRGGYPFTVGAMYRAKSGLETKIAADVTAFVPVQGELNSVPFYSPAEIVFITSARFGDNFTTSFDAAWVKWSGFSSPYGTGNINSYVIGNNQKAANFKDIPVMKWGGEYRLFQSGDMKNVSARLGYVYHPSPVPDQVADSNFVDNTRHGITAGLGFGIENPWKDSDLFEIDVFSQLNLLNTRNVTKLAGNFVGAPGYSTGGKIWIYGAGITMKF
jgi:hypothetical protein